MDIVDVSKEHATDKFRGNDNEKDVLNEMLAAMLRVVDIIRKGENKHRYDLVGEPSLEPFTERFENSLAGWACTMDIMLPNTMNVC
jgi:alpha-amylase/alpha-mannosidase (GH57 family)